MKTSIEQLVAQDIAARSALGVKKYGFTVADNPLPLKAWLQHAYEESLDLPIYLKRAIREIEEKQEALCQKWIEQETRLRGAADSASTSGDSTRYLRLSYQADTVRSMRREFQEAAGLVVKTAE